LAFLSKKQTIKPAYTFKMVDARDHPSQDAQDGFTVIIDRVCGGATETAVVLDALKLGSAAHRVQAFWTNATPLKFLRQRYKQFDPHSTGSGCKTAREPKTSSATGAGSTLPKPMTPTSGITSE
jgi:hypothetical protein